MLSFQKSLRAKLAASMALSITVIVLSGLFAMLQTKRVLEAFDTEGAVYDANARAILEIRIDFIDQVREWKDLLLRGNQPELEKKHWSNFQRLEKKIQESGASLLLDLGKSEAKPHLKEFLAAHAQMGDAYRRAWGVYKENRQDSRLPDALVMGIDRDPAKQLDEAVKHVSDEAIEFADKTQAAAWRTAIANFSLMLIALCGGIAFFLLSLKKNVLAPLFSLSDFARKFAAGQYGLRIPSGSKDEVGEVAQAFNHASAEIERLVADLKASEAQYRDLIEGIDAIVWVLNSATMRFTFVSPSAETILGCPPQSWLENEHFWQTCFHPEDPDDAVEKIAEIVEQGSGEFEHRTLTARGNIVWLHSRARVVRSGTGEAPRLLGITMNVDRLKQLEAQTEFLATHEKLTGLPNRHLLMDRLEQAMVNAQRSGKTVALMLVNIDRFKTVNDSLGHGVGDEVIGQIAYRLLGHVRLDDTVAHLGRDEFAIVLREVSQEEKLADIAKKILTAVSAPLEMEGNRLALSCSIGVSLYPKDGAAPDVLLKNAEAALRRVKASGKNNFRFYTEEMNSSAFERLKLENALRQALEKGELVLHYQPQVDIQTGETVGMEALVRWQHPEMGLVPPSEFIPLAEETGLILPIGEWVMREACRQNKAWQDQGYAPVCVAVNLSARQFTQANLVDTVAEVLEETALDPEYLELEITESVAMHDVEFVIETMHALKIIGVRLAIDDFGTGYSSLNYLKRFPIDKLKIDRSFVKDIAVDTEVEAICSAIIAMAQSMNLRVIAEGVETETQLERLRARRCHEGQGYYFGRPMAAAEVQLPSLADEAARPGAA